MEKAVIYIRVSTEEQAKDSHHSLPAQKRLCEEFAKDKYQIVDTFEDPGKSGSNMNRPALNKMIDFITTKKDIAAVLVQDTDRLARNTHDHLNIKMLLRKNGCEIISISQPQIDNSPEGEMIDTMIASFNTFQSKICARKTKKGMEQRAIQGWLPKIAPLGYKNTKNEHDKKVITIDPEKAPFIKKAFELYISGSYGGEDINEMLYEQGFRSMHGKKLATSKLYALLENPFYYGWFKWGGGFYEGKHPHIITKDMFDLAQRIRKSRTARMNYDRKHNFLLNGFIFCVCGRRFTAEKHKIKSGRIYYYYHCTKGRKCHTNNNIHCDELERLVENQFKEIQFGEEFYDKLLADLRYYQENHVKEAKKEVEHLIRKKMEAEKKRSKMEQLLFDEIIDGDTYKRSKAELEKDLTLIDAEMFKIKQKKDINVGDFEELAKFAKDIYQIYKNGQYETKRLMLGFFWEKFIMEGNRIIEAIPTPLFQVLKEMQKPPVTEASTHISLQEANSLSQVIKLPTW